MSRSRNPRRYRAAGAVTVLALLSALVLALIAVPAAANFETVKTFEDPAGQETLNRTGLAANTTGAGGVPAGTLYEGGGSLQGAGGINRYNAKGESQSNFGGGFGSFGVAVWQSMGCVFALKGENGGKGGEVRVFSADGSKQIASFGGGANTPFETIAESPGKIHETLAGASIAVDSAGKVYVADQANLGSESRIMVFEPEKPGDCEHYAYAGQASDIATPLHALTRPVVDPAGNLYLIDSETKIEELPGGEPGPPSCEFNFPAGGIKALALDPLNGKLFYFTYKDKEARIHVLSPCNGEGKFEELKAEAITLASKPENLEALAFNPTLTWEPERPAGVLYAASYSHNFPEPNYIFALPFSRKPVVESESVANVATITATLRAQINPKGSTTRFAFQYLSEAAYQANEPAERFAGASEAPLGGAILGGGQSPLTAVAGVVGLSPDTAYRYRVIATSHCNAEDEAEVCEDSGSAQAFRTFPIEALGLPDKRAYELVSPAQKNGGEVFPANPRIYSCTEECKPGKITQRFPLQSAPGGDAVAYEGFSFSFGEGAATINEYVSRRTESGWQTVNPTPPLFQGKGGGYQALDSSLDTALFYREELPPLSPEAPEDYPDLYLQPSADPTALSPLLREAPPNRPEGELKLEYATATADFSHLLFAANDALTGPTAFALEAEDGGKAKFNLYESSGEGLRLVNVQPGNVETTPGAVFGSGFKLSQERDDFINLDFSHAISDDGSRIFWSSESGQVYLRVNGEETLEVADHAGKFLTASADGLEVLLGDGCLYAVATESCEDLTQGEGGFEGILGQSEDLSSIYFTDSAALTPEAEENANGEHAKAGKDNLYSWQEGDLSYIATLNPEDHSDWVVAPVMRTAEASPDGRFLAFVSQARLTGRDNTGPCARSEGKIISGPCPEAFLFDSQSGQLSCPSCNPSGEAPLGPAHLPRIGTNGTSPYPQPRYLLDDGRLYFDTQDSLIPADTNDGVEDVYQYEPEGVGEKGTCERAEGCVNLISAGTEPVDSNFLAIDKTGKNIFFTSRDRLVLKDKDDAIDLYDAREDGGIPSETEAARGECQGEACQPLVSPPNDPTPGSSSFEGAGNVVEAKAKKHRHKKKRHAKKHRRAKHNRGGAK
jgi:hypothetical protein